MKKFLLSFLMLIAVVPLWAHDFEVDGIYYNIIDESYKTVEVTYKGSKYTEYSNEYTGVLTIPSSVEYNSTTYSVTSIREFAFSHCSGLTSVTIGNSVTSIGRLAFQGCTGLTEITIPNSVTTIGYQAFSGCTGLTSVSIPNSVTSIGQSAFYNTPWYNNKPDGVVYINNILYTYKGTMPSGTSIDIKEGTVSISEYAFSGCTGLTSITIPNSVTTIGYQAFFGCTGLTSVSIPNSVTSIGSYAFYGCTGLTSVTIGNSVTSIGSNAFYGCSKITVVNSHNTTAPTGAPFEDVVKQSAILNVPSSAIASYQSTVGWKKFANIREMAMNGYYDFEVDGIYYRIISLTDLTAEVVAKDDTYNSYSGEVVIPESVSYRNREFKVISIDAMTFSGSSELTSLTIPQTVTTVGKLALNGCTGLKSLIIADSNTDLVTNGSFDSLAYETLYLGRKASVDFKSLTDLKVITLAGGVTSINDYAFQYCTGLTSVTIGNSVTTIGEYAFEDCINLSEVNITDLSAWCKIDFAYNYANPLYYAHHLKLNGTEVTNLVIPNDITEIKQNAFSDCTGLTSVSIPNSVTSIGERAFSHCTGLTSVTIGNSVTEIGAWALSGCTGLPSVTIGNSVTSIGEGAFSHCSGLTSVTIGNSVTSIGESAFWDCPGLTEITIGNSVTEIGGYAFHDCSGLTSVTIGNSVTSIGNDAFLGCMLNTLVIMEGENPIDMGGNTFGNNPLTSVYIGRTMTNVTSPFKFITSLSKVTLGRGMASLQSGAFVGCTGLKELVIEGGESAITIDCKFNNSPIEKLHIGRNGTYAFNNRVDLKEVSVGDNVTSLPENAFSGCSNITTAKLGANLKTIGSGAFSGCSSLMNVYSSSLTPATGAVFDNRTYLQGTLYVVKGYANVYATADGWKGFWEIIDNLPFELNGLWYNIDENGNANVVGNPSGDSYVGQFTIPANVEVDGVSYPVTSIDAEAFANAINVTSITIEDSNQPLTIGAPATAIMTMSNDQAGTFEACMLDSVYVGRDLNYATAPFANIASLKKVAIGVSVTSMGGAMFDGCKNINAVHSLNTTPPAEAQFDEEVYNNAVLYIAKSAKDHYATADGWKEFVNVVTHGSSMIEDIDVEDVACNISIIAVNGEIIVNGAEDAQIAVYNINGSMIYQGVNRPVAVANKGVYVIIVNNKAYKVAL